MMSSRIESSGYSFFSIAFMVATLCLLVGSPELRAALPDCGVNRCGLLTNGAYRNYVIGTLTHVGSDQDVKRVYHWAKRRHYWQSLPDVLPPYLNNVAMVTITPSRDPKARSVTVFMQRSEYTAAPLNVGDLVRYTPHTSDAEAPEGDPVGMALFHGLTGCVATLCSQTDVTCLSRYQMGLFTKKKGNPISIKTEKILKNGVGIDPVSLLPKRRETEAKNQ